MSYYKNSVTQECWFREANIVDLMFISQKMMLTSTSRSDIMLRKRASKRETERETKRSSQGDFESVIYHLFVECTLVLTV